MFHERRRWSIAHADSAEQLAHKLTEQTWTICSGFQFRGYLFLNDSTSEDALQEYAIVKLNGPQGRPVQVESCTMSWCDYAKAVRYILGYTAGECDSSEFAHEVPISWESIEQHGRCRLCG